VRLHRPFMDHCLTVLSPPHDKIWCRKKHSKVPGRKPFDSGQFLRTWPPWNSREWTEPTVLNDVVGMREPTWYTVTLPDPLPNAHQLSAGSGATAPSQAPSLDSEDSGAKVAMDLPLVTSDRTHTRGFVFSSENVNKTSSSSHPTNAQSHLPKLSQFLLYLVTRTERASNLRGLWREQSSIAKRTCTSLQEHDDTPANVTTGAVLPRTISHAYAFESPAAVNSKPDCLPPQANRFPKPNKQTRTLLDHTHRGIPCNAVRFSDLNHAFTVHRSGVTKFQHRRDDATT
jgi:hypothetical protein